jgi:hypothetical protein
MADRVIVTLAEDNTPVWETDLTPSTHCASTPHDGPRPRPTPYPGVVSSTVNATEPSRHVGDSPSPVPYPDSVPDFSDVSDAETTPSATPNGPRTLQDQAKADEDALEVRIATLIRIPPAPPGLVPRTLPQTHPLTQLRQRRADEQLGAPPQSAVDVATTGLQQVLDRLQQKYPEKQGHSVPTAIPPPIVRHDPSTAPSILVPLSVICQHCGAINLLVKDPIMKQTPNNSRAPQ